MKRVHQLSCSDARRVAVRAQLLDKDRPTDLLDLIRHLTFLQYDQTAAVAPSADVVLWSRLGSSYRPEDLQDELDAGRLIDHGARIRPIEDMRLFRAEMAEWPGRGELREWEEDVRDWVQANDRCRRDILQRLREDGPLRARDFSDTCDVPWRSSGWTNNKNVQKLLDFMVQRGEVAAVGRDERDRLWDLAERVFPDDPVVPFEEAQRIRDARRLRALGIARSRGPVYPVEHADVGDTGEPTVVDGVRGEWRVDPQLLDRPLSGRAALLSPLDRLVYDRKRMTEIFEFDYQLEMYKPAAKRRWGYWALPILYGDRLVGKLDATTDRNAGVLRVNAVHEDAPFSKTTRAAVDREVKDLARWLELDLVMPG